MQKIEIKKSLINLQVILVLLVSFVVSSLSIGLLTIELNEPVSWGLYFQESSNRIGASISGFHGYLFIYLISILTVVTITLYIIISTRKSYPFAYKYLTHHTLLEVVWTATPTLILVVIGVPSLDLLYLADLSSVELPYQGVSIKVIGNQWYWSYNYNINPGGLLLERGGELENPENTDKSVDSEVNEIEIEESEVEGETEKSNYNPIKLYESLEDKNLSYQYDSYLIPVADIEEDADLIKYLDVDNNLLIPQGEYVKMLITSADVIHDFAVPSLGIKIDCNPGRLNAINVKGDRVGIAYGQCSELCGVGHSEMPIAVEILPANLWNNFSIYLIVNSVFGEVDEDSDLGSLINENESSNS